MRALPLVALLGACVAEPVDPTDAIDVTAGGADGAGISLVEMTPGEQRTFDVTAMPSGSTDPRGHAVALALRGAQRAAFVIRAVGGELDPWMIVKDASKRTLASSADQVIAPQLSERDAIVQVEPSWHAYVIVAGQDFASGGRFTVDVVAMPSPVEVARETTVTRVIGAELRALEPDRARLAASGWVTETADGTLRATAGAPLDQRTAVALAVARVNEARETLFTELAPEDPAAAAANLTALWRLD